MRRAQVAPGRFHLQSSVTLMQVMARACGHESLSQFSRDDLVTWKREMAELAGVRFGGVGD